MNKICARCEKVVYPIEELKCLDKSWHKACFKCAECGMTLNLKTYKGFNKLPYCAAHIPKAKATAIADTPELKRIAENTKIQSNVKYHEDFEKAKGKFTQVADDPETLRIKQNTKIISNVAYHGDLERKAAMERQREISEVSDYQGINEEFEYFSEALAAEQFLQYNTQNRKPDTDTLLKAQYQQQQLQMQHQQQQQQKLLTKSLPVKQEYEAQSIAPPPVRHQQPYTASIIQSNQATVTQQQQQQQLQQQQLHNTKQQQYQQQPPTYQIQATNQQQQQQQPQQQQMRQQQASNKQNAHQYNTLQTTRMHPVPVNYQQYQTQRYDYAVPSVDANSSRNTISPNYQKENLFAEQTMKNYYTASKANSTVENNNLLPPIGMQQQHQHQEKLLPQSNIIGGVANDNSQQNMKNNNRNNLVMGMNQNIGYGGAVIDGNKDHNKISLEQQMNDFQISSNGNVTNDYDSRQMQRTSSLTKNHLPGSEHANARNYMYPSEKKNVYNTNTPDPRLAVQQPQNHAQYFHHQKQTRPQLQKQPYYHQQLLTGQTQLNTVLPQKQTSFQRIYRALYDYEAQDTDEVSFREGDLIYEVDSIDSGWLTGQVERTGQTGMLPANYVESAGI